LRQKEKHGGEEVVITAGPARAQQVSPAVHQRGLPWWGALILLIQYPTGKQHYISFGPGAIGSDAAYDWDLHLSGAKTKYRIMTISYTEVDAPIITS